MALRYGTDRRSRVGAVAVGVVVALFLLVVAVVGWKLATPAVSSAVLRFEVVSDSQVTVTFEVHRRGSGPTVCVLRAQGEKHEDVGYATVTITPGRDYLQPTYPLATAARATSADLLGCGQGSAPAVDPPQFPPGTVNPPQVPTIDGS